VAHRGDKEGTLFASHELAVIELATESTWSDAADDFPGLQPSHGHLHEQREQVKGPEVKLGIAVFSVKSFPTDEINIQHRQ
jgi:hypothetical protein